VSLIHGASQAQAANIGMGATRKALKSIFKSDRRKAQITQTQRQAHNNIAKKSTRLTKLLSRLNRGWQRFCSSREVAPERQSKALQDGAGSFVLRHRRWLSAEARAIFSDAYSRCVLGSGAIPYTWGEDLACPAPATGVLPSWTITTPVSPALAAPAESYVPT